MIITIPTNHPEEIKVDRVTRTSEVGANGVGWGTMAEPARRPL